MPGRSARFSSPGCLARSRGRCGVQPNHQLGFGLTETTRSRQGVNGGALSGHADRPVIQPLERVSVVIALYPACVWFSRVKARSKRWWLSYL